MRSGGPCTSWATRRQIWRRSSGQHVQARVAIQYMTTANPVASGAPHGATTSVQVDGVPGAKLQEQLLQSCDAAFAAEQPQPALSVQPRTHATFPTAIVQMRELLTHLRDRHASAVPNQDRARCHPELAALVVTRLFGLDPDPAVTDDQRGQQLPVLDLPTFRSDDAPAQVSCGEAGLASGSVGRHYQSVSSGHLVRSAEQIALHAFSWPDTTPVQHATCKQQEPSCAARSITDTTSTIHQIPLASAANCADASGFPPISNSTVDIQSIQEGGNRPCRTLCY